MTPLRALIVDDEPLARETIRLLLADRPDVDVAAECANGEEAVAAIRKRAPDLVFLDVQMPALDGFGVIREVGADAMPVVIFATAYDQYALHAFDAQALDYLLKPFDDARFFHALDRGIAQVRQAQAGPLRQQLSDLLDTLTPAADPSAPLTRLMVRTAQSVEFVDVAGVDWIEAAGDYVVLHAGADEHLIRDTMSGLLQKLDSAQFVRIHRSTIVNVRALKKLKPYFHGDYLAYLHDGTELRLSRRYWDEVQRLLGG